MATKNLFAKAKGKAEPKKAAAKDEKVRVNIDSYEDSFDKMSELAKLNEEIKTKTAMADILSQEIKEIGKTEFIRLATDTGKNPGSFMLEALKGEETAQVMFIAADKYISIKTEDEANILRDTFGEEIVTEKTEYKFNAVMLEKYSDIISELIANCEGIKEADKDKIIEASVAFSIKKGAIDEMSKYGDIQSVVEAIRPIISLKGTEVIKG